MEFTIEQTPTGWYIETRPTDADGNLGPAEFTATLPLCRADHSDRGRKTLKFASGAASCDAYEGGWHVPNVEKFMAAVARTYSPRVTVPVVPFDASITKES